MTQHNNRKNVIEAYNYLYEKNQLGILYNVLSKLQKTVPFNTNTFNRPYFYPNIEKKLGIIYTQYLYSELITRDFNDQLLLSLAFSKKISHPLPSQWRAIITQNSIKVNNVLSGLNFALFSLNKLLKNYKSILSLFKHKIFNNKCDSFPTDYIELCDISKLAIPGGAYNIFNWLILNYNSSNFFNKIYHNLDVVEFSYSGFRISSSKYFLKKNIN